MTIVIMFTMIYKVNIGVSNVMTMMRNDDDEDALTVFTVSDGVGSDNASEDREYDNEDGLCADKDNGDTLTSTVDMVITLTMVIFSPLDYHLLSVRKPAD